MGLIKDALEIAKEIQGEENITESVQARPGYRLYNAAEKKLLDIKDDQEIDMPLYARVDYDHIENITKIIKLSAEAGVPDWTRTSSGVFKKTFDQGYLSKKKIENAQWLFDHLPIQYTREGNSFTISAEECAKLKEAGKGLRLGHAAKLPL